jgi:hypothetical protein
MRGQKHRLLKDNIEILVGLWVLDRGVADTNATKMNLDMARGSRNSGFCILCGFGNRLLAYQLQAYQLQAYQLQDKILTSQLISEQCAEITH